MSPDEAKAIIDRFAAADSSLAAIAAVARQLIDQVAAAAVTLAERERKRAWRAHRKAVPDMSRTGVPDAVSARARSSSSSLREDLENGGGGDPRARALDENVSAEGLTNEVERIVKENGHWPSPRGWVRSATVEQIERRLRLGQKPSLIVDAVNHASRNGIAVGQPH